MAAIAASAPHHDPAAIVADPRPSDSGKGRFSPDLRDRVRSAVPLAAAALAAEVVGGWFFALFVALGGALMAYEWRGMALGSASRPLIALAAAAGAVPALVAHVMGLGAGCAAAGLLALAVAATAGFVRRAWISAVGVTLIAIAAAGLVWMRDAPEYGLLTAMWLPLVVAGADMGGYFAGRRFGGPKLAPSISPNKTWSGAIGGWVLACIIGAVFSGLTQGTNVGVLCAVSIAAAIISQGGDLAESWAKRRFGVKDAGSILPGHGGVLDRLDGLIAASLFVTALTVLRGEVIFQW